MAVLIENQPTQLDTYVTVTQNNSHIYSPAEIVNICKRRNNTKRDFLFVNSLQGKHLHVEPAKAFSLYNELVSEITNSIDSNEKIVVIGFAETATAISHYIATRLPNCIYYMQTTREVIDNAELLLEFKEEHSHATEQCLYGKLDALTQCDRIIFVDDEISTGNTVLNFIREITKLNIYVKFSVASFLNWQNDEWTQKFDNLGIDCFYILRGKLRDLHAKVCVETSNVRRLSEVTNILPSLTVVKSNLSNFTTERIGSKPVCLDTFEKSVYTQIMKHIRSDLSKNDKSILVLGTEEFMFTPMVFADILAKKLGVKTQFHATTRSPIETSLDSCYAINSCYPISSCYDSKRNTFVYNLQRYDKVFIVTDVIPTEEFMKDISSALIHTGCNIHDIKIIVLKG